MVAADLERVGPVCTDRQEGLHPGSGFRLGSTALSDWRLINAQALVAGPATDPAQRLRSDVLARLYDVFGQAEMGIDPSQTTGMGYTVTTHESAPRRASAGR